eukprot:gene1382-2757_t
MLCNTPLYAAPGDLARASALVAKSRRLYPLSAANVLEEQPPLAMTTHLAASGPRSSQSSSSPPSGPSGPQHSSSSSQHGLNDPSPGSDLDHASYIDSIQYCILPEFQLPLLLVWCVVAVLALDTLTGSNAKYPPARHVASGPCPCTRMPGRVNVDGFWYARQHAMVDPAEYPGAPPSGGLRWALLGKLLVESAAVNVSCGLLFIGIYLT